MRIVLVMLFFVASACGGEKQESTHSNEADTKPIEHQQQAVAQAQLVSAQAQSVSASTTSKQSQKSAAASSAPMVVPFVAGVDYVVRPKQTLSKELKLEEYFSYSCPHCYHAEPAFKAYMAQKPAAVTVHKIPVGFFKPTFEVSRLAAILAEVLGKKEELHDKIFEAIHGPGGRQFRNEKEVLAFFAKHGITEADYKKALESEQANALHLKYRKAVSDSGITGVPAFIIRNKYQVAHRHDRPTETFVALINFLMAKTD